MRAGCNVFFFFSGRGLDVSVSNWLLCGSFSSLLLFGGFICKRKFWAAKLIPCRGTETSRKVLTFSVPSSGIRCYRCTALPFFPSSNSLRALCKRSPMSVLRFWQVGRRRRFISPFTRLKAWWMGIEDASLLARYGEDGPFRSVWIKWRGTIIVATCTAVMFGRMGETSRSNDILDNIELNRQRYYKREFAPEYVPNAPEAVYDGPKGYSYRDEVSGIMVNADGKLTSDLTREERRARLEQSEISSGMLEAARRLRESPRYQRNDS
ncbi:hypothetical protein, conserved [Trypanosoma brucei gambiense DAL972]|uniref:Uncharacterized protein n=2 Tax=Trypanosoma brucei TaxID=5691 RepID=C9ZYA5_TRYB9|nr:hypothetical protein, conserved [Trypanosoma brucei gambiense DAL972]CBH14404.1 hypothetical protein, conserved [Trypanosoma brucei gambiense DAL972]|eukprot:XP_011776670.1 hypothetical protein, conserved [Trypanosoma brucei gambiense DAL972]